MLISSLLNINLRKNFSFTVGIFIHIYKLLLSPYLNLKMKILFNNFCNTSFTFSYIKHKSILISLNHYFAADIRSLDIFNNEVPTLPVSGMDAMRKITKKLKFNYKANTFENPFQRVSDSLTC